MTLSEKMRGFQGLQAMKEGVCSRPTKTGALHIHQALQAGIQVYSVQEVKGTCYHQAMDSPVEGHQVLVCPHILTVHTPHGKENQDRAVQLFHMDLFKCMMRMF